MIDVARDLGADFDFCVLDDAHVVGFGCEEEEIECEEATETRPDLANIIFRRRTR